MQRRRNQLPILPHVPIHYFLLFCSVHRLLIERRCLRHRRNQQHHKFQPIPTEPRTTALIIIPVSCSCSGQYYQQNSYYTVQSASETYLIIANNTYQGLTTCQAMMRSNTDKTLRMGVNVNVPLRCTCPTLSQTASGFKYLLTYVVIPGENISEIADRFGADRQSVLDANEMSEDSLSAFTTVLIPLKSSPIVSVFSSNYSRQIQPPIPL